MLTIFLHLINVILHSKPDGTHLYKFVPGYPSWTDYLRSMEKDGTWGDHLILRAAANCYKARIRVISSLDNEVNIHPDHCTVDITNPLVLGHIHEKHYVSFKPRKGNCEGFGEYAIFMHKGRDEKIHQPQAIT